MKTTNIQFYVYEINHTINTILQKRFFILTNTKNNILDIGECYGNMKQYTNMFHIEDFSKTLAFETNDKETARKKRKALTDKEYKRVNKDILLIKGRNYRTNNMDKINAYLYKNADKIKEQSKKYKQENKEKVNTINKRSRDKSRDTIIKTKLNNGNKGDDWIFYTLEFTHKKLGFKFFKYGITSRDINYRYKQGGYGEYTYEILDTMVGSEDYIKVIERKHLLETINYKFIFPEGITFGGKTECRDSLAISLNIV